MFAQGFSSATLECAGSKETQARAHTNTHQCITSCSLFKMHTALQQTFKTHWTQRLTMLPQLPMLCSTLGSCDAAALSTECCYDVVGVKMLCVAAM